MQSKRLNENEIGVLRELAKQIKDISQDPIFKQKELLWTRLNGLKKTRPLILCVPQAGYDEIIPPSTCVVKDPLFRGYELNMRQLIYKYHHFQDDQVITDTIYVPYDIYVTDWVEGERKRSFADDQYHAEAFHACIVETSDIKKLRMPTATLNREKSDEDYFLAKEVFDGILNVVQGIPFSSQDQFKIIGWGNSLIDVWCQLRGLQNVYMDLIEEPEFTKDAMQFLMEGSIRYLRQGEEEGWWLLNNNGHIDLADTPCGSNGLAYTDELPSSDYDGHVRLKDLWGYTMAQEFTVVSAEMLGEFVLPYQLEIQKLFGLNAYGCCENEDHKWDLIKRTVPNLRVLAVSPHCDLEIAVENIKDDYVMCWRPNPGQILGAYDRENNRKHLKEEMHIAEGTHLNVSLREIQTVYNNPIMLDEWVADAMELAMEYE